MLNGLSIDLEEWYHPQLVQPHLGDRPRESRVIGATEPLLALLDRHEVRATFFCVGEVVRQNPEFIRRLHEDGHEIGFHTMKHTPLWHMDRRGFETELEEFDRLIVDSFGGTIRSRGFRAPTFSLGERTAWALDALADRGYLYDSSVFPARSPLYGLPGAPLAPYRVSSRNLRVENATSSMIELPLAVGVVLGLRVPVGGGIYVRLLPSSMVIRLLRKINTVRPFVIYLHPWELDPGTPRMPLPALTRVATYAGIDRMLERVDRLLGSFRFTTLLRLAQGWLKETAC